MPQEWGYKNNDITLQGPHAGVLIEIPMKHRLSLQAGLIVSHKGEAREFFGHEWLATFMYSPKV